MEAFQNRMQWFFFFLVLVAMMIADAGAETKPDTNTGAVKTKMHEILVHVEALRPYMSDEVEFKDKKNESVIKAHLEDLAKLIKSAKHEQVLKTPTLSISRQVLEDHFGELERVYRVGNKSYARWMLNSTLPICISCHTQVPSASRSWDPISSRAYKDDFEHGEFLFTARNFDKAIEAYDKVVDGYPANGIKTQNLDTALERKMAIYSRVKRDFAAGIASIEKSQKNKNLPEHLNRNLDAWKALFRMQKGRKIPDPKVASDKEIKEYVETEFKRGLWDKMVSASDPRLITNLTVSGVLYEYLTLHPKTEIKPDILLWLAQCDRDLQNNFFFSLADLYLRNCMDEFPKHPTAKKCYKEYADNIYFSYSGSAGTSFPMEVEKELKDFKKKIFGEGPKN